MDKKFMRIIGLIAVLLMLGVAPAAAQNQQLTLQVSENRPAGVQDCVMQYGLPPQPQIGHPSMYLETGVDEGFDNLCLHVEAEFTLIVGGTEVNDLSGGVYLAYQTDTDVYVVLDEVQNGFVLLAPDDWAQDEFSFRLNQAREYGWAHEHVFAPEGWSR